MTRALQQSICAVCRFQEVHSTWSRSPQIACTIDLQFLLSLNTSYRQFSQNVYSVGNPYLEFVAKILVIYEFLVDHLVIYLSLVYFGFCLLNTGRNIVEGFQII